MIASTQMTNTKFFVFITILVFKEMLQQNIEHFLKKDIHKKLGTSEIKELKNFWGIILKRVTTSTQSLSAPLSPTRHHPPPPTQNIPPLTPTHLHTPVKKISNHPHSPKTYPHLPPPTPTHP